MKKSFYITLFVITIIVILGFYFFAKTGNNFSFSFNSKLPQPEITYGEFPFKLIYEINNEEIIIENTLVIEHEGIGYNKGLGTHNIWKTYYKNSDSISHHYKSDLSLDLFNDYIEGVGSVRIFYELGSCEYYMGLDESNIFYEQFNIKPGDIVIDSPLETRTVSGEELYDRFNIKIIEKSISRPISQQNYK